MVECTVWDREAGGSSPPPPTEFRREVPGFRQGRICLWHDESRLSDIMNLKNKIQNDLITALKSHEKQKVEVLRFLNAQIQNKEIDKGRKELTKEEIIALINNEIKKLKEGLALFEKGKREDLVEKTQKEIEILKGYLPAQLSDEELEKEIERIIGENPEITQSGPLIGMCVKALAGKADNKKIAQIVMKKTRS